MITSNGRKCDAEIRGSNTQEWRTCLAPAHVSKTIRIGNNWIVLDYCKRHKDRNPDG